MIQCGLKCEISVLAFKGNATATLFDRQVKAKIQDCKNDVTDKCGNSHIDKIREICLYW